MTRASMTATQESPEQREAIDAILRKHGGALTYISDRQRGVSIVATVYAEGVSLGADNRLPLNAPIQARYRVLDSGEIIDISPGLPGLRPEGGQL